MLALIPLLPFCLSPRYNELGLPQSVERHNLLRPPGHLSHSASPKATIISSYLYLTLFVFLPISIARAWRDRNVYFFSP